MATRMATMPAPPTTKPMDTAMEAIVEVGTAEEGMVVQTEWATLAPV